MTELEQQTPPIQNLIVYLCPTEGCGNYYGTPAFRKDRSPIDVSQTRRSEEGVNVPSHNRIQCPACRARGKMVDRVPYLVTAVIPLDAVLKKYGPKKPATDEPTTVAL